MLGIIDYQAGNQTSVLRALESQGLKAQISQDQEVLQNSCGLIFPGVGAAGQAMQDLKRLGLDQLLKKLVAAGKPLLGICLGSQILLENSEEDQASLLGLMKGKCLRFKANQILPDGSKRAIPHMG
ncbi:MAG: imidazole glycerol phosphate synthase subunit HisH [Desulfovibrionaceae bacterium]|nr:imidazole glycerol phosphate synthase subunit HisH [Desulfovibrionaceae bacterium]